MRPALRDTHPSAPPEPRPPRLCKWWRAPGLPITGSPAEIFVRFWDLPGDWFESLNKRRGGWSGVSRHVLDDGEIVFVKRQENHFFRDPLRFGLKAPTFRREWRVMKAVLRRRLAVPEMLLYAERKMGRKFQAILITRELEGYEPLHRVLETTADPDDRASVMEASAEMLRQIHLTGFEHKCMNGKHILLRDDACGGRETCTLDLEKAHRSLGRLGAAAGDFTQLLRNTPGLAPLDRANLLAAYCKDLSPRKADRLRRSIIQRLTAMGKPERAEGVDGAPPQSAPLPEVIVTLP